MEDVATSSEAAAAANQAATVAKEGETVAVETSTAVTETDAAAVEASTIATTVDTAATELDTAATVADTAAEEAKTVAVILDTASEEAETIANEVSAASEYWANGGVAGPSGNLSFFANGSAFTNSIVDSPTLFKFAQGSQFGVMGEAGPEAVMPLSRDSSGRLGVSVNGGTTTTDGSTVQNVNISITVNEGGSTSSDSGSSGSTSSDDSSTWKQMADRVKAVVVQELVTQKRPGGILAS